MPGAENVASVVENVQERDAAAAALQRLTSRVDTNITTLKTDDGSVVISMRNPKGSHTLLATELCGNSPGLGQFITALLCVAAVNNEPQPTIRNRDQLDKLADALGMEGVQLVVDWYGRKQNPEIYQAQDELGTTAAPEEIGRRASEIRRERAKK